MKKALTLLAAVAMLTAPVFAEVTVTGDFELDTTVSFNKDDTKVEDSMSGPNGKGNDFDITLGAKSDFTTLKAEIQGKIKADVSDDKATDLNIDDWEITQDITGALAIDGPATLKLRAGSYEYGPIEYCKDFVEYDEIDVKVKNSYIFYTLESKINDSVTVRLGGAPATFGENSALDPTIVGAIAGAVGPVKAALNVMTNGWAKKIGEVNDDSMTVSYQLDTLTTLDDLKIGVQVFYDKFTAKSVTKEMDLDLMVGVSYSMDALSLFGQASISDLTEANDEKAAEQKMLLAYAELSASYDVSDMLSIDAKVTRDSLGMIGTSDQGATVKHDKLSKTNMRTTLDVKGSYALADWLTASLAVQNNDLLSYGVKNAKAKADAGKKVDLMDTTAVKLGFDGKIDSAKYSLTYTHYMTDLSEDFADSLNFNLIYEW